MDDMFADGVDLPERTGEVDAAHDGARLDKALEILFPEFSLRGRRRIFAARDVLVNGKPRPMSYKVKQGQALSLAARKASGEGISPGTPPRLLVEGERYLAFFKPAGLHTESLGPGGGPSLEAWAGAHFPAPLTLLTRLDFLTSGIVLAARDGEAASGFRAIEDRGEVDKRYACLVRGELREDAVLGRALDTDNRAKTRVLDRETDDPLRRTAIRPLAYDSANGTSLLLAAIKKGARHQIRAHLAAFGFPLVGDPLYGGEAPEGADGAGEAFAGCGLFLAHVLVRFPGFSARCEPDWAGLPEEMKKDLDQALDAENGKTSGKGKGGFPGSVRAD